MTLLDVRVRPLPFADAVEEVLMMRGQIGPAAGELLQRRVLRAERLPCAFAEDHVALRAVERDAVLVALLHVRGPVPLLVDELSFVADRAVAGVVEDAVLVVRKLLVVVEEELAAEGGDATRV